MTNMKQLVKNLINEDSGQDLIEYALVAALVGLGAVAAMKGLSNNIGNAFNSIGSTLSSPFASETVVTRELASSGAIGHGPRTGHTFSAASTV